MSSDSDYSDYEDSEQDEGSPENHFKILSTAVPLNFSLIMNPERIRAIRVTETRCALVRGRKNLYILSKVIPSSTCPVDSVIVPKLLQFSLDVSIHDSLCVLPFDGKIQADAIHIVPLFDPGLTDYTRLLTEYFCTDYHPVSIGSAFSLFVNQNVLNFRVVKILPTDRCIAWKNTRVVMVKPSAAPTNSTLLGRHFSDVALTEEAIDKISQYVLLPVQHPTLLKSLGVRTGNGVLVCGGHGAGKSTVLMAISREAKVPYLFVKIPDLMAREPPKAMTYLQESFAYVAERRPALLLLDDLHVMGRIFKPNNLVGEAQLAALFISLLDRTLAEPGVVVVATANHPEDIDESLQRLGRFAFQISLPDPLPTQRAEIIRLNTVGVAIDPSDIARLSGNTTDRKSCADVALLAEVAVNNMIRNSLQTQSRFLTDADIFKASQNRLQISDFPVAIESSSSKDQSEFEWFEQKKKAETESAKPIDPFAARKPKGVFET